VICVTANRQCAAVLQINKGEGIMAGICAYEGWWDLSLIDEKSERALLSAFVAAVVVWATAFLLELI
jgi:hypothetical protein